MAATATARHRWLILHGYLGLTVGGLFALLALTGSLLAFYIELDEVLNPQLVVSQSDQPALPYAAIVAAIQRAEPQRIGAWRLEIPQSPQRMITARFYKPAETQVRQFAPLLLSVNPYTAEVVARRFWGQTAMTWLYDLHYTLLLDSAGKLILALLGGFMLMSLVSGIYLWWPNPGKWRSALTFKRHASRQRQVYDWHKLSGSYGLVVMLVLVLTGVALEVPQYLNPLIDRCSELRVLPKPRSRIVQPPPMDVDSALQSARRIFGDARLSWIETPADAQSSYRFNFRQAGEPGRRFPKSNVWIDQYSGHVLAIDDPQFFRAGDVLLAWLHPLHSGEAFGLTGRILVALSGGLGFVLYVSGVWRWLHKRRAQALKRGR